MGDDGEKKEIEIGWAFGSGGLKNLGAALDGPFGTQGRRPRAAVPTDKRVEGVGQECPTHTSRLTMDAALTMIEERGGAVW